jgi:hypothetical protein
MLEPLDMWLDRMPSFEAARPVDILPPELSPLFWVWAWTLPAPALWPFSAAQEGVAAAKAIAPTTPSMSGSFITALFISRLLF